MIDNMSFRVIVIDPVLDTSCCWLLRVTRHLCRQQTGECFKISKVSTELFSYLHTLFFYNSNRNVCMSDKNTDGEAFWLT